VKWTCNTFFPKFLSFCPVNQRSTVVPITAQQPCPGSTLLTPSAFASLELHLKAERQDSQRVMLSAWLAGWLKKLT
jgi:hypothetical protein